MTEQTQRRIRDIAQEEYPGCEVEFAENRDFIRISLDGTAISRHAPPPGFRFADLDGQTDGQLRQLIQFICTPE